MNDTWEIQLTIAVNFVSSKDIDEERLLHSKSDDVEVTINDNQMKLLKNFFNHFFLDIKSDYKQQMKVAVSSIIMFI